MEVDREEDEVHISSPAEAEAAALEFSGGSFNTGNNEVRTPVSKSFGWGFGIFDENNQVIKSFDIIMMALSLNTMQKVTQ